MVNEDVSPIENETEARLPQTLPPTRAEYVNVPQQEAEPLAPSKLEESASSQLIEDQTETFELGKWPINPQRLHRSLTSRLLTVFVDIVLIIFPFLFLGAYLLLLVHKVGLTTYSTRGSCLRPESPSNA